MKQMTGKWMMKASLMALVMVTFVAACPAHGQTGPGLRLEVPYAFTFASKVLPPGIYSFTVSGSRLAVASATSGPVSQSFMSKVGGPIQLFRNGSLIFDKTDAGLILAEVWIPGLDGVLLRSIPKGHTRTVLSAPDLNKNRTYSGKAAFNLTCAKCHGPDGNGSKEANKFFDTPIPKLNSPEVQAKTDDELRNQIALGSAKMPPVEVDESGFRHRLPPREVDAVIAYVRTLKK